MARHQPKPRDRGAAARAAEMVNEASAHVGETAEMMRDVTEQAGEQARASVQQGMEAGSRQFAVLGEQAFDTWMKTSNEALQRVLELNVELASWGREQLDDSMDAVRSLSQCRSFGDAYGIQLGLVRSSMENSLRHANKLFTITAPGMAAAMRRMQPAGED